MILKMLSFLSYFSLAVILKSSGKRSRRRKNVDYRLKSVATSALVLSMTTFSFSHKQMENQ